MRDIGAPSPDFTFNGRASHLRRRRHSRGSSELLAGDEPVDSRVHEGKDGRGRVEHGEVELLAQAGHVGGQRHAPDDPSFDAALEVLLVGIVEMGKGPRLQRVSRSEPDGPLVLTKVTAW